MTFQIDFESEVGVGQTENKVSDLCKKKSLDKQKSMADGNYKISVTILLSGQWHTTGKIQEM